MRTREFATPTCIELFAGAGGMMLGLEMAGFKTLVANEVHPHPCLTLKRNFPNVPVVNASIRDLTGADLLRAAGLDPRRQPEIDLIAGGPPCQGYSTAGMKDVDDPRNTLIGDFIRIVRELRPRYFILENVTGLQSLHNGRLFENVLEELAASGYSFRPKTVFAADYGVPQMRRRLIVIGARQGAVPDHPAATYGNKDGGLFERGLTPYTTCGDALGDLPAIDSGEEGFTYTARPSTNYQRRMRDGAKTIFNHEASRHRQATMDYYGLVPAGGTCLDIPKALRNGKQGIQRWPLNGLARTITTEPTDFLHPTLNRIPTVRELARIQSFPDRYEFMGQRTTGNKMRRLGYCSQTQQVGNAVPPMMAEAIGAAVMRFCLSSNSQLSSAAERKRRRGPVQDAALSWLRPLPGTP
ncbi:MAG: DNA cytosine methyltransferase [Bauldia sp.]|nr:DNA cytosine methyltransferase [Bauldia sp.]